MSRRARPPSSHSPHSSRDDPSRYAQKRDFTITPEPSDAPSLRKTTRSGNAAAAAPLTFVIQKHHARQLHYDFRLELDGALKSWAIPKGPSLDPSVKRLAVHVEDHPLSYAAFEGTIPAGQYGAGDVIIWDRGIWTPEQDPAQGYRDGKLSFTLSGSKLSGRWNLIRTRFKGNETKDQWLLIKEDDAAARDSTRYDVTTERPESVGRRSHAPSGDVPLPARKKKSPRDGGSGRAGRDAAFPTILKPQLATLMSHLPPGKWLYEIKFDGYRLLTRFMDGQVRIVTRNGKDWTARLPRQVEALSSLPLNNSWLDGEVVVHNNHGVPDFQALQNAFDIGSSDNIIYYLFDAPFLNGRDLRQEPLEARRRALEKVINATPHQLIRFSETFASADYRNLYQSACAMSLEGIIAKRADSLYDSARSADWVKLKCLFRQEFVIIGYTDPKGRRKGFGALLLGLYRSVDSPDIVYAGRVGTGFNETRLKHITGKLRPLSTSRPPLADLAQVPASDTVHWVRPELVCEVEFSGWTQANIVRHAVFVALREDKPATDIVHEEPVEPAAPPLPDNHRAVAAKETVSRVAGVSISNPHRIIDSEAGSRKVELAAYYASVAGWILPHLKSRPVSLLRAPAGVDGEQFFQKHAQHLAIPNIKHLAPSLDPGHAPLMEIDSVRALVGAVQMGTIELHTWGATSQRIENPDRIILDLDPGETLPWRKMIEAAQLTLAVLDELGLDSYLKTSGGKGIHIAIPIARHLDWTTTKSFAKAISSFMTRQLPERFTDKMGPKNRIDRVFIDYLRNSRGASTVTAYSARARPGLPVSVPIRRDELESLQSARQWTILNLHERLEELTEDPWKGYGNRQRITQKMWASLGK